MKPRWSTMLSAETDTATLDVAWNGIHARRRRRRWSRRALVAVPMAVALAVVLLVVLRGRPGAPSAAATAAPLMLAGGAPLPAEWSSAPAPRVVPFDDGSRVELDANAKLRATSSEPGHVNLALDTGKTTFDVKPGGSRAWVVRAGDVGVRVLGTRFSVRRAGSAVEVEVERGKVLVESARLEGGARLLGAGESVAIGEEAKASANASATATANASPTATANASPTPKGHAKSIATATATATPNPNATATPTPNATPTPTPNATATPTPTPNATPTPTPNATATPNATPSDAMADADLARRDGRPRDAVAILTGLVDRGDPRAALAAFTIAKLEAGDLGNPGTAALWFERAIRIGLPAGLDEEAHARVVESHFRAGRKADAARAAARYESRFPHGRQLERVRAWTRE